MSTPRRMVSRAARSFARGCTKDSVRCPQGKSYLFNTPDCCRSHVAAMMAGWGRMLTEAGVTWWIDYGTLLGAVRNPLLKLPPGLIPHDKDADIGVLGEHQDLIRALASGPYVAIPGTKNEAAPIEIGGDAGTCELVWKPPKGTDADTRDGYHYGRGDSFKLRWSAKNHINIDAFHWYPEPNGVYKRKRYIGVDRYKGRTLPEDKLFPLRMVEWEGLTLPAPADPEWVAQHRYGPSWKTPLRRNNDRVRR